MSQVSRVMDGGNRRHHSGHRLGKTVKHGYIKKPRVLGGVEPVIMTTKGCGLTYRGGGAALHWRGHLRPPSCLDLECRIDLATGTNYGPHTLFRYGPHTLIQIWNADG